MIRETRQSPKREFNIVMSGQFRTIWWGRKKMVNYGVNGVIGADPLSIQGRKRGKKRCPKYKFYATSMRADDTAPLSLFSFVREWHTSPRIIFPPFHILFCALQYYCVTHTLALQDTLPDTAFSCPLTTTVLLSVLMIKSSSFHILPQ